MSEANGQERTSKRAKAIGQRPRFRGAQGSSDLSGDEVSVQLQNYGDGTTSSKRSQPDAENSPTKKMRLGCDPARLSSNKTASSEPHPAALTAMVGNSGSERHDVTALQGLWRRRNGSHSQRCPNDPFKNRGVTSLSCRVRLSPYAPLETAQQRRVARAQDKKTKDIQKIKRDMQVLRDRIDCVQEESKNPANEGAERSVSVQSVPGGAIPKKRFEESDLQEDVDPILAQPCSFNKNTLEAENSRAENSIEKVNEKAAACVLSTQDPKTETRNGTLPFEDHVQNGDTESTTSESDLAEDELAAQLMDSYTDSQTMVRSLRQMNEQYAEKIEALNMQLSQLENRCLEDKLRTELHCAELQHLRKESAEKLAGIRERAETFEKQHHEDQRAIEEHQQQLAALSTQLEQSAEKRRLEQNRFERLQLDSQQELASQQQTLASCQRRLERLDSVISRQRECLECSICLGLFSEPVTLGCGHTFCELCIVTNQRSAVLPHSCPLCRQFIGSPARSAVISQLIDLSLEMERCQV